MAKDLFTRAKAYRKNHPNTPWTKCVQAVAAGDRATAKKKAAKKVSGVKKATVKKAAAKKVKIKYKPGKKGTSSVTIGKPSMAKQWGKDRIKDYAAKSGLRLTHGYDTVARSRALSGISMDKVRQELKHQEALHVAIKKHQALKKTKGLKPAEKAAIQRDIDKYKTALQTSKKHVTALKRSI